MVARAPGEMGSPAGDGAWHGEADEVVGIAMANSRMRQAFALRIVSLLGFSKSVAADCGLRTDGSWQARRARGACSSGSHRGRFRHGRGRRRACAWAGWVGPDVTEIHEPDPSGEKNMPQYSQPKRNVPHLCYRYFPPERISYLNFCLFYLSLFLFLSLLY